MKARSVWFAAPLAVLLWAASPVPTDISPVAERAHIEQHLLGAERQLAARDVSHLSPSRREARSRHLAELRAYRLRGLFPHNHASDRREPTFVDLHGTRCAMAHLIERAGGGELVAVVARKANQATIAELASEPALIAWLDENGLTVEEAARIQPEYDPGICAGCASRESPSYAAMTAVEATLGVTMMGWNLSRMRDGTPGGLSSLLGIAIGFAGVGMGLTSMDDEDPGDRRLAAINGLVGLGSLLSGTLALGRPTRPAEPEIAGRRHSSVAPLLASSAAGEIRLGVRTAF